MGAALLPAACPWQHILPPDICLLIPFNKSFSLFALHLFFPLWAPALCSPRRPVGPSRECAAHSGHSPWAASTPRTTEIAVPKEPLTIKEPCGREGVRNPQRLPSYNASIHFTSWNTVPIYCPVFPASSRAPSSTSRPILFQLLKQKLFLAFSPSPTHCLGHSSAQK